MNEGLVTVELFGTARHRAGTAELRLLGRSLEEVVGALEENCPGLKGLLTDGRALSRMFLFSLDGERFLESLGEPIPSHARLLIFGADAGG